MTLSLLMTATCAALLAALLGACVSEATHPSRPVPAHQALVTVRYQVHDLQRAIAFYTANLGFQLAERSGDVFAAVVREELRLILSGPGSSGSRPMPDGRRQEPGGWNRIVLYVDDLAASARSLRAGGVRFRNDVEAGPGGTQILIEDPDGNPIELHQPPPRGS